MSKLLQGQLPLPTKKARRWWQGYTAATSDQAARAAFVAKFGREPETIRRSGGGVLAGPVTVQEVGR